MVFKIELNHIHTSKFIFCVRTVHARFCQQAFNKAATCEIWTEYQGASTMALKMYNYINLIYVVHIPI